MSLFYLVRHGQASFFAENYDRLSSLGETQARRLGEYFIDRGVHFDAIYTGPAQRQIRTAELLASTMNQAGGTCPAPTVIEGLDEHSGALLLSEPHARKFFGRYPELAPLAKAFRDAREPDDVQRSFQKLFEEVIRRWSDGELNVPGVEQWQDFHDRARRAIESIVSQPEFGRTVLAVSSVGPITVALQMALAASIPVSRELGWRLRNTSVTTFVYTRDRMTLDGFNSTAHLANAAEITYR